ncbi:MAG: diguanylate cyclase, partial [Rudaea sp.]
MPGILVVERSATLSHLLRRTLAAGQMEAQTEVSGYLEAIENLQAEHDRNQPYELVILGAPARMTREFSALLDVLRGGIAAETPLILMAHEKTADLNELISGRPKTSLMPWSNFSRIPGNVRALLPTTSHGAVVRGSRRPLNSIRILLVDDSQSMREAYRRIFERGGFEVTTADSIRQATSVLERDRFDIVVVDYFLPDGNGEELCRRLSSKPDSPVLAIITGTYREEIIKRCIDAGASECLFKNEANELTLARVRTLARQIQSQKTVEAERQRLDGILGSVGDGVFGVDNEGVITFMNPTGLRLLDWPDEAGLLGQSAHTLIHPTLEDGRRAEPRDSVLTRAYAEGQSLTAYETLFWSRNGESMPIECSVLPLAIQQRREGSVVVFRDISGRKSAERLRWEATHDSLTSLLNLREMQSLLAEEIQRRRETGGFAALLHVDVDRFSYIEDAIGAAQAERLLVEVAGAMSKLSRAGDAVARLDGDKFALLLVGVQLENLYSLADGFREVLHQCHYVAHGSRRNISVSIGVAVVSKDAPPIEQLLDHARHACKVA